MEAYHCPIRCTEFKARGAGSICDANLPLAKAHHVVAVNWVLEARTYPQEYPATPLCRGATASLVHEAFHLNGTSCRKCGVEIMRELAGILQLSR